MDRCTQENEPQQIGSPQWFLWLDGYCAEFKADYCRRHNVTPEQFYDHWKARNWAL